MFDQVVARQAEQPCLGTAKAVNRLLRVAHQKDRRHAVSTGSSAKPALQHPPLQRIGILKFVQQNMPVTRIQLELQVFGLIRIRQQARDLPFDIGEIQHAACVFEALVVRQQGVADRQRVSVELVHALCRQPAARLQQTLAELRVQCQKARIVFGTQALDRGLAGAVFAQLAHSR